MDKLLESTPRSLRVDLRLEESSLELRYVFVASSSSLFPLLLPSDFLSFLTSLFFSAILLSPIDRLWILAER